MKAMKKIVALVVPFWVSIIITAVLLYFNVLSIFCTLYAVPFITSALAAFGMAGLYKSLCVKNGVSAATFWLLTFLPQLVMGIGAVVWLGAGVFGDAFDIVWSHLLEIFDFFSVGFTYGISGTIFTRFAAKKLKRVQQ